MLSGSIYVHLDERFQGIRVLVVDDVESNRDMIAGLLDSAGFNVDTASNGVEALEAVKQVDFDLILMDISMPVVGGMSVIEHIRELPENRISRRWRSRPVSVMRLDGDC